MEWIKKETMFVQASIASFFNDKMKALGSFIRSFRDFYTLWCIAKNLHWTKFREMENWTGGACFTQWKKFSLSLKL